MLLTFVVITLVLLHVSQLQSVQNVQGKFHLLLVNLCLFLKAIAQVYMEEGDAELMKEEPINAAMFYTRGIGVNCKDDQLNAILYFKRFFSYFALGEFT